MNEVFADTFFYLALLSRDASSRARASEAARSIHAHVVTTAYVLLELANSLSGVANRPSYLALARRLRTSRHVTVVPASQDLFDQGEALYAARPDKDWSLTDCISFVVMRDRGISDALTGDHHFEQAGFTALLETQA